jgi:hypothetical protein
MDYIAGEDLKKEDLLKIGSDGKLYKLDSKKLPKIAEKEFINSLYTNPAFKHINLSQELYKMDEWIKRHPDRHKTRLFVLRWLERKEIPLNPVNDVPDTMRRYMNDR